MVLELFCIIVRCERVAHFERTRGDEANIHLSGPCAAVAECEVGVALQIQPQAPASSSSSPSPALVKGVEQRMEQNDSSISLLSRRGSEYGSRHFLVDDAGVFFSSGAVTVMVSSAAIVAIVLMSLVVTLGLVLGSCEAQQQQPLAEAGHVIACRSFVINAELGNLRGWIVPEECEQHVGQYVESKQYPADIAGATQAAYQFLLDSAVKPDGLDVVVLDIDETSLSNLPYYRKHHYGAEVYNETLWNEWVAEASAPPIAGTLRLYQELAAAGWGLVFLTGRPESQRNDTTRNLLEAGYQGWIDLILRSDSEHGLNAHDYKSRRRSLLEAQGYRVWTSLGDQWSDLSGPAAGNRTFKLPNPLYFIP